VGRAPHPGTLAAIRFQVTGSDEDLQRAIDANAGLISRVIYKHYPHHEQFNATIEDCIQGAQMGLVRALRQWNPELGAWATYSYTAVRGAVGVALRAYGYHSTNKRANGRWNHRQISQMRPGAEERVVVPVGDPTGRMDEMIDAKDAVRLARAVLSNRDFFVLYEATRGVGLGDIAAGLGVSRSRVGQIRARALWKVRSAVAWRATLARA